MLLELTADIILHPAFAPPSGIATAPARNRSSSRSGSNPGFLANEMFNKAVFGTHPAARIYSNPLAIDAVTAESLAEYHRTHYVPDNAVMAFAGDITLAEARSLVEKHFAGWKRSGIAAAKVADPGAMSVPKVYLVDRPISVQTTLYVGTQGLTRMNPDFPALAVANRVLGGAMGRLFVICARRRGP